MKNNMIYAVFLIIFATLGGILAGSSIHTIHVKDEHKGASWTGFVIGIFTTILAGTMVFVTPC